MTEDKIEHMMVLMIDSSWKIMKCSLLQIGVLFLMSFLWGFNLALCLLVVLYTFLFGTYFLILDKEQWWSKWLAVPYLIYSALTIVCSLCWDSYFPSIVFGLLFPLYGAVCVIAVKLINRYIKKQSHSRLKRWLLIIGLFMVLFLTKSFSNEWWCRSHGSIESEKQELIERRDYLVSNTVIPPDKLLKKMPKGIGAQFQGEWALYTCSMLSAALTNMATLYPDTRKENLAYIDSLIQIVMSAEIRAYDGDRWGEDPLNSLESDNSHISYISHLSWMMLGYKASGGDKKYDVLLADLCKTMNRRIVQNPSLNLPTYPGEPIYVPDMLVAIVALSEYSQISGGRYSSTVRRWMKRAKTEWIDRETGLLVSLLQDNGKQIEGAPIKGSYTALNCSYLTYIDDEFSREQYAKLKSLFWKDGVISGFKEYHDRSCFIGFDIDAGPIIGGLSPSATAFATGAVTYCGDDEIRQKILRTAEKAGHTIAGNGQRHYALADMALVGEAIMLAMRTHYRQPKPSGVVSKRDK